MSAFRAYAKDKDVVILSEESMFPHDAFYPEFWDIAYEYLMSCARSGGDAAPGMTVLRSAPMHERNCLPSVKKETGR